MMEQKLEMERDEDAEKNETTAALGPSQPHLEHESLSVSRKTLQAVEVGDRLVEVLNELLAQEPEDDEDEGLIPLSPDARTCLEALAVARFGGDRVRAIEEALFALATRPPSPAPSAEANGTGGEEATSA